MNNNKNYKNWYIISCGLLAIALIVHLSGYFTNVLYIIAWLLWMPVIALVLITFFDIKNSSAKEKKLIFSKESFKTITFAIVIIMLIYVIINMVYGFGEISSISDIKAENDSYYIIDSNNNSKEIGYNEYVKYSLISFRLLSGHMLAFIAAPIWYFKQKENMNRRK